MHPARIRIALTALTCASITAAAPARQELQTVTSNQPGLFERFGSAVATQGDLLVCSGATACALSRFAGTTEVFRRVGHDWVFEQELYAPDGQPYDRFGNSLALDDGFLVVGAPLNDEVANDAGAAYAFQMTGGAWVQTQKLAPGAAQAEEWFGWSVCARGGVLVVGAPRSPATSTEPGAAYVFRLENGEWVRKQRLREPGAAMFGWQVSVAGDLIVVGAVLEGAAYVYRFDGSAWTMEQKLVGPFGSSGSFGYSVCTDGRRVAVGDPNAYTGNPGGGAAWVYRHDGTRWIEEQELRPVGAVPSNAKFWTGLKFGTTVALDGEAVVVGAPWDSEVAWLCGAGFLFRHDGVRWTQEKKISARAVTGGQAGTSAALAGERTVLDAPLDVALAVGTVYVHDAGGPH